MILKTCWHTIFAKWSLVTQSRLCHFVRKWSCGMWGMSLETCRWDLWPHFWKMTYFDTIAVVSNCEKLKIFDLVLVELVSRSSNMALFHNLEFNWSVKYLILCASDGAWHNLSFLINLYWTNLYQNCFGECTDIADQDPDKIYAKMTLGDTTAIVSPESNPDEFCHFDARGPIWCSCTVFWDCNIKNKSF